VGWGGFVALRGRTHAISGIVIIVLDERINH
jgi:hypothetical protein